jgi:electron transport complex protein RnfG
MSVKSFKPALVLIIITVAAAFMVGLIHDITLEPIAAQRAVRETETIAELLPGTQRIDDKDISSPDAVLTRFVTGYDGNGRVTGYVVAASPNGYAGAIDIMVGFDPNKVITGVKIVHQGETPGLGTEVEEAYFLDQFPGKTRTLTVTKMRGSAGPNEIEALVSATISTNAVVKGVNDAIEYINNRGD